MEWISVLDRLPEGDMPVFMVEPLITWDSPEPGGTILLGIFRNGEFLADRPQGAVVRPTHWLPVPKLP